MTPIDQDALERAIEAIRKSNAGGAVLQIEQRLEREGFEVAGKSAAYSQQVDNLHLMPWEVPPCWVAPANIEDFLAAGPDADDTHGWRDAARLLQRLLDAGLSRYEPNPANALLKVPPVVSPS
jgi:hypothetical protein